jgi:hypothetical protein
MADDASETIWHSEPTEFHGPNSRKALLRDGDHCHIEWQDETGGTWTEDRAGDRMPLSWPEAVAMASAILAHNSANTREDTMAHRPSLRARKQDALDYIDLLLAQIEREQQGMAAEDEAGGYPLCARWLQHSQHTSFAMMSAKCVELREFIMFLGPEELPLPTSGADDPGIHPPLTPMGHVDAPPLIDVGIPTPIACQCSYCGRVFDIREGGTLDVTAGEPPDVRCPACVDASDRPE